MGNPPPSGFVVHLIPAVLESSRRQRLHILDLQYPPHQRFRHALALGFGPGTCPGPSSSVIWLRIRAREMLQRRPMRSMDTTTRVSPGPDGSPESTSPAGCWYRRFRRRRRPDRCERAPHRQPATAGVGFPGRCPPARRLWAAGADVAVGLGHRSPVQLVVIALYLYDPHLNKLKGVNCGPVSQTRVCEPHNRRDSSTDSSTWTAPELTRSQSENRPVRLSPSGQAWQDSTSQCQRSSAHTVHFSAAAYRADLRAAGDRGPAPSGSGAPVPGGRLRHGHFYRQTIVLQRRFLNLVSFWSAIASRKARP